MVIPIHDKNPVRRTPWVTYLLIAVNFAVFLAVEPIDHLPIFHHQTTVAQVCHQEQFFERYGAIPRGVTTTHPIAPRRIGVRTNQGVVACPKEQYDKSPALSILFAMFLHGGWLHILGNMLFLFVFGNNIEDRFGRLRFLAFYLASGYVAAYAFAFAFASSTQPLIGASGAIAGVLGAYLVLYPKARVWSLVPFLFFIPLRLPAWVVLGFWFLLQYAYSQGAAVANGADVAYLAHVAGFLFGVLVAFTVRSVRLPPPRAQPAYGDWNLPP
jgi:membrane associated rhomboid family serine protease